MSLTRLPESIGDLQALASLDLYCCEALTTLPGSVGNLQARTKLILDWLVQGADRTRGRRCQAESPERRRRGMLGRTYWNKPPTATRTPPTQPTHCS